MIYIDYTRVNSYEALEDAKHIRNEVFVKEQGIDPKIEIDEFDILDLDKVWHFVGYSEMEPICTCRVVFDGPVAKLGRVAVMPEWRGQMIAQDMIMAVEMIVQELTNTEVIKLSSQGYCKGLYEKLGYQLEGEEYIEDVTGIPHIDMFKILD